MHEHTVTVRHRALALVVMLGLLLSLVGLSTTAVTEPVVAPVADLVTELPIVAPVLDQVEQLLTGQAALAATYMFTAWYWTCCSDARMYCHSIPVNKPGGRYCSSGYLAVKYPGSSSFCYRRNTYAIFQRYDGLQSWHYSGGLYYVC